MKFLIELFILTLFINFSFSVKFKTKECPCSYGGMCINFPEMKSSLRPCKECKVISDGYYKDDCYTLVDHCASSPCLRGQCISTIGGYYCKCPTHFTGTKCRIDWRDHHYSKKWPAPSNEVYVYYQVQPKPNARRTFTVMYDVDEYEFEERQTRVAITVSDGRAYYPRLGHFSRRNVNEECMNEAKQYPNLLDSRVCKMIPKKSVLAFSFDPSLSKSTEGLVHIPGIEDPVGRSGHVTVLVNQSADLESTISAFNQGYKIFTYYHSARDPYHCMMTFSFNGCSVDKRYPVFHPRGSTLEITVERSKRICSGALIVGRTWYHQSLANKFYASNDPVPVVLEEEYGEILELPPLFLNPGLQLFVIEYTLEGDPPHYGGVTKFQKSEHCFVNIEMGKSDFRLKGGSERVFSCLNPFEVQWENLNRNMHLTELLFFQHCNHTSDPVCQFRQIQDPLIRRNRPPACDDVYLYTLTVVNPGRDLTNNQTFQSIIRFKRTDVELGIICRHNCDPVHPGFPSIWVAFTKPYIRGHVQWKFTHRGIPLEPDSPSTRRYVRSFLPDTASRIFVSQPGLFDDSENPNIVEDLSMRVTYGGLHVVSNGKIHLNKRYVKLFELQQVKDAEHKFVVEGHKDLTFTYFVFLIDNATQGAIMLVKSNYIDTLRFVPYWNLVVLCGHDIEQIFSCSSTKRVDVIGRADVSTVDDLLKVQELGRIDELQRGANYLIWNGLSTTGDSPYRWKLSVKDRSTILDSVEQTMSVHVDEVDLLTVLHMLSMIFYSENGVNAEGIQLAFEEEIKGISTSYEMVTWMAMRDKATRTLESVAEALEYQGQIDGFRYLLRTYPFGDILNRFMYSFSLAFAQAIDTYEAFLRKGFVASLLTNEIKYSAHANKRQLEQILLKFALTVSHYSVLYSGVETYGNETVILWSLNDSYIGLMDAVNKTVGEGWKFFTEVGGKKSSSRWYTRINLQLPDSPLYLQFKDLSLTAVVMKNRQLDLYLSPIVILLLRTQHGQVKTLPANQEYRITLPAMEKGKLLDIPSAKGKFHDSLERRSPKHNFYTAYKVTFPKLYSKFSMAIYLSAPVPIKVKPRLDRIPDYDEVFKAPSLKFEFDKILGFLVSIIKILPRNENKSLPRHIYLGILPSEELPIGGKLDIFMFTEVKLCRTRDIDTDEDVGDCERVVNDTSWDDLNIICRCKLFGITSVHRGDLALSKFIISYVPLLELFDPPNSLFGISLGTAICVILPFVVLATSYFSDKKRRKKEGLIYTKDCFRCNTYVFIVGVYTGHRVGAGTISTVAVQLQGQKGVSQVIVLKPTKRENWSTLNRGRDDWFFLATREHIGNITALYVWQNFRCTSPWYCTQILIFDASNSLWFRAEVNKWFKLHESDDKSLMALLEVQEYHALECFEIQNFVDHVIIELENTHHTFSLFEMHRRGLYTREERTTIVVLKLLAMFCWICFSQEVLHEIVFGIYFDPVESKNLIDLRYDTFVVALIVSILSTISMVPLETLYRFGHLSTVVQKLTTNNILMERETVKVPPSSLHFDMRSRKSRLSRRISRRKSHVSKGRQSTMMGPDESGWIRPLRGNYCSWSMMQDIFLSPTQFYLVDARTEVLDFKMRYVNFVSRCLSGIVVLAMFGSVFYLIWGTEYVQKASTTAALLLITLVVDSLIVNPSYILIRSFIQFYILEATSQELVILYEDNPQVLISSFNPNFLSYQDYITMATGKDYKPQLSSKLRELKRLEFTKRLMIETMFFMLGVVAAVLCILIYLKVRDPREFYGVRAMKLIEGRQINRELGTVWVNPGKDTVRSTDTASFYIIFNYIQMEYKWSSERYISDKRRPWGRDKISRPMDACLLTFYFMSNGSTSMPTMFEDYFNPPNGYYSEGTPYIQPLVLDEVLLHYNDQRTTIKGFTGQHYQIKGHNISIPTEELHNITGRFRFTFEALKKTTVPLRATFMTINFVNIFIQHVYTVDLIIEYLPSGFSTARIEINAGLLKPKSSYVMELFLLLGVWMLLIIVIFFALHNSYYGDLWKKLIFVSLILAEVVVMHNDFRKRYNTLDDLIYNPHDKYQDLHTFYTDAFYSSCSLIIIPCLIVLNVVWVVRSMVGTDSFKKSLVGSLHMTLAFCVVGCFLWLMVLQVESSGNVNMVDYIITHFYTKNVIEWRLRSAEIGITVMLIVIFNKVCSSLVIHEYFHSEEELIIARNNVFILIIKTFKSQKSEAQSKPKKILRKDSRHGRKKSKGVHLAPSNPSERVPESSEGLHQKFRFLQDGTPKAKSRST